MKAVDANTVNELQETQKRVAGLESPLGHSLQGNPDYSGRLPGGETYYRNRATAGEATAFNSHPFWRRVASQSV